MSTSCRTLDWTYAAAWHRWLLPFQEAQNKPGEFQERIRYSIKIPSRLPTSAALPGNRVRCLKRLLQRLLTKQLKGETLPQCAANLCSLSEQSVCTSALQQG